MPILTKEIKLENNLGGTEKEIPNTQYTANFDNQKIQETNYVKQLIQEDSYNAILDKIEAVQTPDFNNPNNKIEKLAITLKILGQENETIIPHFIKPIITKGSINSKTKQAYSNSKMFDLLADTKLTEQFKQNFPDGKYTTQHIIAFLSVNLEDKILRVQTKTSKANTPDAYSTISKILRIIEPAKLTQQPTS